MPTADRQDEPGAWHHVMNRGIARRTVFEDRADLRYLLSRIAWVCRARELELHAYAILSTHFHLLVRSPSGALSAAMMWIEHEYVRWFNRRRRRDGTLFRGRFMSRRVDSASYWRTLLRYIDANPVAARIATRAVDYPWCSAWHYAQPRGPIWLSRSEVEGAVAREQRVARFAPARYAAAAALDDDDADGTRWIVERRLADRRRSTVDPLDDLVGAAPATVRAWMRRKAALADGGGVRDVLASPDAVVAAVRAATTGPDGAPDPSSSVQQLCCAGLLRELCGMRHAEIALRVGRPRTSVVRVIDEHRRRVRADPAYAELAAAAAQTAIRRSTGATSRLPAAARAG